MSKHTIFLDQYPDFNWLLDENDRIIAPLFRQWGVQHAQSCNDGRALPSIVDVVNWGLDNNLPLKDIQPAFDWICKSLSTYSTTLSDNADQCLKDWKRNNPDALQELLLNTPIKNNVWNTSFLLKYAPDPKDFWAQTKQWHDFYKGSVQIWLRKESQPNPYSDWQFPSLEEVESLKSSMGDKAFLLWQYGAFFEMFNNKFSRSEYKSGSTYNMHHGLHILENCIQKELAPDPQELLANIFGRFKGKDLLIDVSNGLTQYMRLQKDNARALNYSANVLKEILPLAIKNYFHEMQEASKIDALVLLSLEQQYIDTDLAVSWFAARIKGTIKDPIDFKNIGTHHGMSPTLFDGIACHTKSNVPWTGTQEIEAWTSINFEPTLMAMRIKNLSENQWRICLDALDGSHATLTNIKLLLLAHPKIEQYKKSVRARASIATCIVVYSSNDMRTSGQYRNLHQFISSNPLAGGNGSKNTFKPNVHSLPPPFNLCAAIFPEQKKVWQQLALTMNLNIHSSDIDNQNYRGYAQLYPEALKPILNSIGEVILGHPIDLEKMLLNIVEVKKLVDANVEVEDLIMDRVNALERPELSTNDVDLNPTTFDFC